jgi:hypothetical protein
MPINRPRISEVSQEKVVNLIPDLASKVSDENAVFETPPILPDGGVTFVDGSQRTEAMASKTRIIRKTSSYTLNSLDDRDSLIEIGSEFSQNLIIPTDARLNFPIGTSLDILQTGTGQVTITSSTITTATYSTSGAIGETSLVLSAENLNVEPGQMIEGTGIYEGTLVTGVSGATITVDTPFETQVSGDLTFKVGVVATPGPRLRTRWSSATLIKRAKNSWMLFGDLSPEVIFVPPPPATVPSAPPAPTVRVVSGEIQDYVTIIEPTSNGGSEITVYNWESSDGKIGNRDAPGEFTVSQEAGTSQTYRARAVNAVGASEWSANSQSVTTPSATPTFSFSPAPTYSTWYCSYSGPDGRARSVQSSDLSDCGCDYAVVCSPFGYPDYPAAGGCGCAPPPPPPCSGSFYCGQTTRCCSQARLNAGTCPCTDQCNSCGTFVGCECT